jgi:hypothetical protein
MRAPARMFMFNILFEIYKCARTVVRVQAHLLNMRHFIVRNFLWSFCEIFGHFWGRFCSFLCVKFRVKKSTLPKVLLFGGLDYLVKNGSFFDPFFFNDKKKFWGFSKVHFLGEKPLGKMVCVALTEVTNNITFFIWG